MNFKNALMLSQIYIHIGFFIGLFFVPFSSALLIILVSQIVYVGLCGTVYFHRVLAHRHPIHPIFDRILLFLSWVGVSGSAIAWAGTHRKHHRHSDTDRDPHSPKHSGWLRTYWYSSGDEDIVRYVPDLLRQPRYILQHKNYFKLLLILHTAGILLLPPMWYWGLLIVPAFLMWLAGSSTNILCHDNNGPINRPLLGFLMAGEGWHQNHHQEPNKSSFGHWSDWGQYIYNVIKVR